MIAFPLTRGSAALATRLPTTDVAAEPMSVDARSRKRPQRKSQNYIDDFFTEESARLRGTPKKGKMRIYVNVRPDSDPKAFEFHEDWRPWPRRDWSHRLLTRQGAWM